MRRRRVKGHSNGRDERPDKAALRAALEAAAQGVTMKAIAERAGVGYKVFHAYADPARRNRPGPSVLGAVARALRSEARALTRSAARLERVAEALEPYRGHRRAAPVRAKPAAAAPR